MPHKIRETLVDVERVEKRLKKKKTIGEWWGEIKGEKGDAVMSHLSRLCTWCHLLRHSSGLCIFIYITIYIITIMKTVPCQSFCGIRTCNEPTVSTTWAYVMSVFPLSRPLSLPPSHHLCFWLLSVLRLPPCTPHLPQHQRERRRV